MSSKNLKKGNLTYLHKKIHQMLKNNKMTTLEETVIDGPKGLSIKYFSKSDDDSEKITIFGNEDKFKIKTNDDEKTVSRKELFNEIKKNKKLKFAIDYVNSQNDNIEQDGGSKKSSKKSSQKLSKKSSKKLLKKLIKKLDIHDI